MWAFCSIALVRAMRRSIGRFVISKLFPVKSRRLFGNEHSRPAVD
jgi:hypothetical protein